MAYVPKYSRVERILMTGKRKSPHTYCSILVWYSQHGMFGECQESMIRTYRFRNNEKGISRCKHFIDRLYMNMEAENEDINGNPLRSVSGGGYFDLDGMWSDLMMHGFLQRIDVGNRSLWVILGEHV